MKECKECKIVKEISEYYLDNKSGKPRSSYCKTCHRIKYNNNDRTEYFKKYREENKESIKIKNKEFRENNKELVAERKKKYYEGLSEEKKFEIRERKRILYHKNENYKNKKLEYVKNRLENDFFFKLMSNIRCLIRNSLKRGFTTKSKKTIEILGCTFEEFKLHLESNFDESMNWENQGTYWHIDHIIPISWAETEEDVYKLNHFTNLQPLYWLDNIKKSNKS